MGWSLSSWCIIVIRSWMQWIILMTCYTWLRIQQKRWAAELLTWVLLPSQSQLGSCLVSPTVSLAISHPYRDEDATKTSFRVHCCRDLGNASRGIYNKPSFTHQQQIPGWRALPVLLLSDKTHNDNEIVNGKVIRSIFNFQKLCFLVEAAHGITCSSRATD